MNPLRGISHLCLKFGREVDRRTFEKVVGTAGGVLGGKGVDGGTQVGGWIGLRSLEVGFHDSSSKQSRRDEALYKALQISLPRYKSLRSLRLFVSHEPFVHDHDHYRHLEHYPNGLFNETVIDNYDDDELADDEHESDDDRGRRYSGNGSDIKKPSGVEQILIDSWLKLCPSLEVVTLFSGSQWRKDLDDREELWPNKCKVFVF